MTTGPETYVHWMPVDRVVPHYGVAVLLFDGERVIIGRLDRTDVTGHHFESLPDEEEWVDVTHWALVPIPPKSAPAQPGEDS